MEEFEEFDITPLRQTGARHKRLRRDLDAIRPELAELIRKASAAGIAQVEIAELSGYTRDQIRQITLPPGKRRSRAGKS
jgi:hypothetical protein